MSYNRTPTTAVQTGIRTQRSFQDLVNSSDCAEQLSRVTKPTDIEDVLFNLLKSGDMVSIQKFWAALEMTGLRETDPRLKETKANLDDVREKHLYDTDESNDEKVDRETFKKCTHDNIVLIGMAFKNEMVIPEFWDFTGHIDTLYYSCQKNTQGTPAQYIPQLARADPNLWGISVCTVDGQRHSIGDTTKPFSIQSCSKPLTYALAMSEIGVDETHKYVGQEPSGRSFNELTLDCRNKPHNPLINAGAIITAGLLKRKHPISERFEYTQLMYSLLAGGEYTGFSNSTYLSERATADRNFALGYYMKEHGCFPEGSDLVETLEFYFMLCSIEITAESGAVIAATLANGGICPITGEKVLSGDAVRNTLSLMYSCGMYDYSGQFAFHVGLPAKSGVAGAVLLVVPNLMGICTWSPPLDKHGNSNRGIQFCEELIDKFSFHNYDNLKHTTKKMDPRVRKGDVSANSIVALLFAASNGDLSAMRRFALSGMDLTEGDYDGRTALHLAAAEGRLNVVKFLLEKCKVPVDPKDRWGFTPSDDAKKFQQSEVEEYFWKYKPGQNERSENKTSLKDLVQSVVLSE
ncbi:unnamed protein product [Owenia fusiformis]|uniref:glutaminase n=1 Tax=Owenia fusiformis TaxID=6347 RepID=A0A8J1TX15_OWEFU|nr:unnamed protein product [Owenia fusiformis]